MDKLTIGSQIKYQRLRLGLTQTEFGNKIGITKQCLSGWEHGRAIPDVITLKKIADFCNVNIDTFFKETDEANLINEIKQYHEFTDKEQQLINKLHTLSPERRKAVEILFGIRDRK